MEIRKSTESDFETIMSTYAFARKFMAAHGNPNQWGATNLPPEDLIHKDIAAGKSYVCISDGKIAGTFFYNFGKDIEPTYRVITDGKWLSESPYGVIHRIASNGTAKGVGAFCINWAYAQSGHLRIDTHSDNVVMQNLLAKLNFVRCGIIYVYEDNFPRFAFEKI